MLWRFSEGDTSQSQPRSCMHHRDFVKLREKVASDCIRHMHYWWTVQHLMVWTCVGDNWLPAWAGLPARTNTLQLRRCHCLALWCLWPANLSAAGTKESYGVTHVLGMSCAFGWRFGLGTWFQQRDAVAMFKSIHFIHAKTNFDRLQDQFAWYFCCGGLGSIQIPVLGGI